MEKAKSKSKFSSIVVLCGAHLINDMYSNFLPQLVAVMIAFQSISMTAGTLLVSIFSVSSSMLQPVFGYVVDQKGQRWMLYIGTLWMSVLLGLTGYITNVPLLFIVSILAGLGTAAFHPQAASVIGRECSGSNHKGVIMSAFFACGNIGLAISPLVFLPLFHNYGIEYTWVAIIPGAAASLVLYKFAPRSNKANENGLKLSQVFSTFKKSSTELVKLMVIVSMRSLVTTGLMTMLPVYFLSLHYSAAYTGSVVFAILASGAVGGMIGGYFSDRFGRKPLIAGSLILSSVFFYGFMLTDGFLSLVLLVLGGMTVLSSFSVTVLIAQEIIPENKALASGLSLGFAIGIGGLCVSLIGKYAEVYGVHSAVQLLFALPLFAGILGLFLRGTTGSAEVASKSV